MGYHAIVDHVGLISGMDILELDALLRRAAEAANAVVLDSNFHDFGDGLGNTGVLLLAESHISVHTWPENNYAAIDIFVCSDRECVENAISVLRAADDDGVFDCQILERKIQNHPMTFTKPLINVDGINKIQN